MDHDPGNATPPAARDRPAYPLHKLVAALEPAEVNRAVEALAAAGFARDRIGVIASDVAGPDEPVAGRGLRGVLARLALAAGDDLDATEQARGELAAGHVLVLVPVRGDAERDRARAVLREHGGDAMRYFGRWTITPLDAGPRGAAG